MSTRPGSVPAQPRALRPRHPNVGTLLLYAYRRFEAELFRVLGAAGHSSLRPKHGRVLANVESGGSRITDLAGKLGMTKPAAVELVDELEELGYVRRTMDPTDARAKRVLLTPAGLEVASLARRTILGIEAGWAARLGRRRFSVLRAALATLATADPEPDRPPSRARPRRNGA